MVVRVLRRDPKAMPSAGKASKVEYVRHAAQKPPSRRHTCHWPGCNLNVAPALWGCRKHWYALPATLRARIWATYRPGQEETMTPSREYVEAAQAVQDWIAKHGTK